MKTKSKALLLSLCAVVLVAASVLGTMAYLTSKSEVQNTFTVGSVKITLDEVKVNPEGNPVDEYGNIVGYANAPRVTENTYKLMPGHRYLKDPTVHIAEGSEPCYVRMFVTISKADALSALYNDQWTPTDWGVTAGDGWDYYEEGFTVDDAAKTATYEFRCENEQYPGDMPALFTSFTVDGNLTGEQIATLEGMTITVTAEAIQADGFDTIDEAFDALTDAN